MGGEVAQGSDFDFLRAVLGGVQGPGGLGHQPVNAFHGVESVLALLGHPFLEATAGDGVRPLAPQGGGAGGAPAVRIQLLDLALERRGVQRRFFPGSRVCDGRLAALGTGAPAQHGGTGQEVAAEFLPAELTPGLLQCFEDARDHFDFF